MTDEGVRETSFRPTWATEMTVALAGKANGRRRGIRILAPANVADGQAVQAFDTPAKVDVAGDTLRLAGPVQMSYRADGSASHSRIRGCRCRCRLGVGKRCGVGANAAINAVRDLQTSNGKHRGDEWT